MKVINYKCRCINIFFGNTISNKYFFQKKKKNSSTKTFDTKYVVEMEKNI